MKIRLLREKTLPEIDKYIVIDTHGGLEDFLAIYYAIKLAKVQKKIILGITCSNGRRTVDNAVRGAALAIQLNKADIPIFKGTVANR